jgi:Carboxypeptidase regulatory-like domain
MRSLGRGVWDSRLGPRCVVWFSLSVFALPLFSQSQQQPPIFQSPDIEAADGQRAPDRQSAGTISGTVIDRTGAVIVGARVTLTRGDRSASREVLSGDDGQFAFANVIPGAFQIRITAAGFVAQTSSGILHSGEFYIAPPVKLLLASVDTQIQVTASRTEVAEEQVRAQEKQRILAIVPNFYVSYVPDAAPLSSKQKFRLAWKTMIDPVTFVLTGAAAGVQQAQNDFSGYGQGAQGYAKRFGASYADNATSTFIGSALLPSLLKQDPRYFYKGTGSTRSRILYAIANSVICKGDNQKWQFNYSAILGGFASGAISNLYYPPKDRGASLVFENTLIGTGETAVFNLLQEFLLKKLTPHAPKNDPPQPNDPPQRSDPSKP